MGLNDTVKAQGVEPKWVYLSKETIHASTKVDLSTYSWRFKEGDNQAWADPSFNDSTWKISGTDFPVDSLDQDIWQGIGWFRLKISVDSSLHDTMLGLFVYHTGASEIYLDGEKIGGYGRIGDIEDLDKAFIPKGLPLNIYLDDSSHHLLAVRYSNRMLSSWSLLRYRDKQYLPPGFAIVFGLSTEMVHSYIHETGFLYVGAAVIGLLIAMLLLHLFLFIYDLQERANLYYGLALFFLLITHIGGQATGYRVLLLDGTWNLALFSELMTGSFLLFLLLTLALLYTLFSPALLRHIKWGYLVWTMIMAVILVQSKLTSSHVLENVVLVVSVLIICIILEMIRVCSYAAYKRNKEAQILVTAQFIVFIMTLIWFFVSEFPQGSPRDQYWEAPRLLGPDGASLLLFYLPMPIAMTLILSRRFAKRSKHLEKELATVKELSEKTLVQEREKQQLIALHAKELEKRVEERTLDLENANSELQKMDQVKSRFFANISHEFRTPLTLILGPVSDLLKANKYRDDQVKLQLVQKNAVSLLQMINQILDLSKVDSGSMKLALQPINLTAFCKHTVASFSPLALSRRIELSFDGAEGAIWASLDTSYFEKILYNLLSNAIKYTRPSGSVQVILKKTDSKEQFQLVVRDTGVGISEEALPHIFDRFYQVSTTDFTTDLPSTGIGLALTRELVELHGGQIHVQSQPGKGTSFVLTFPYNQTAPATYTPLPSITIPHPGRPHNSEKTNAKSSLILLIEDNQDVLNYLQSCLSSSFNIVTAKDGATGIDTAITQVPDLIITDVMMPEIDGFEVTKRLKAHETTSHIPIIILTGKSSPESKFHSLEIDADDYLAKPFESTELLLRIENLLRNRTRLQSYFSRNWLLKRGLEKITSQEEAFMNKVLAIIEENVNNEFFNISALADAVFMDRSQLYRKLEALTGKSPSMVIRSYRLSYAKKLLEANIGTVTEIAYEVGFRDPSYFSRCYKEEFGYSPSQTREPGNPSSL